MFVLLLNDLYLKTAYASPLTGKLSDFAGVFLLTLILFSASPTHTGAIGAAVCVVFAWWKSSASDPFIEFVQGLGLPSFGRTVDYSDLVALVMVAVAARLVNSSPARRVPPHLLRQLWAVPTIGLAAFGILGTSSIRLIDTYQIREATGGPASDLEPDRAAIAIRYAAEKNGLKCMDCTRPAERGWYEGGGIAMRYEIKGSKNIAFSITGEPVNLFFGPTVQQKVDALQNDLKFQFSRFTNLEFVEPIPRHR